MKEYLPKIVENESNRILVFGPTEEWINKLICAFPEEVGEKTLLLHPGWENILTFQDLYRTADFEYFFRYFPSYENLFIYKPEKLSTSQIRKLEEFKGRVFLFSTNYFLMVRKVEGYSLLNFLKEKVKVDGDLKRIQDKIKIELFFPVKNSKEVTVYSNKEEFYRRYQFSVSTSEAKDHYLFTLDKELILREFESCSWLRIGSDYRLVEILSREGEFNHLGFKYVKILVRDPEGTEHIINVLDPYQQSCLQRKIERLENLKPSYSERVNKVIINLTKFLTESVPLSLKPIGDTVKNVWIDTDSRSSQNELDVLYNMATERLNLVEVQIKKSKSKKTKEKHRKKSSKNEFGKGSLYKKIKKTLETPVYSNNGCRAHAEVCRQVRKSGSDIRTTDGKKLYMSIIAQKYPELLSLND